MFKSDHSEYRNVILAALLSFLIVIGWQYFFITPRVEKSNQLAKAASLNASAENKLWSNSTGVDIDGHTLSNQTALDGTDSVVAESSEIVAKRITIETSRLGGGINLKGAKVDSLFLKDYTESKEKNSKNVEILSEQGTPHPYYVIQGWTSADSNFRTPGHDTIWEVMPESSDILSPEASVVLKWSGSQGVEFYRTFTVDNNFMIHIQDRVVNKRKKPIKIAPYGIILRQNLEKQRAFFVLHEGAIGMLDERLIELPYKDIREFPFNPAEGGAAESYSVHSQGWFGFTDKYWMTVLHPQENQPFSVVYGYKKSRGGHDLYRADMRYSFMTINPGEEKDFGVYLFSGAKEVDTIRAYRDTLNIERFDDAVDWGWFSFLTKPMFDSLMWINSLVGNLGVAIILLTIVVKLALYPLSYKSFVSMSRMQKLQPEMGRIRDLYKDDKMKLQQEMLQLYRKEKINPAAGCLPIFMQIPVFFALYKVLFVSIEMRQAPFFGWISDLAAPDPTSIFNLFGLLPYSLPVLLTIGVWPCLMGLSMWLQQQLNPQAQDPIQRRILGLMPLMFTVMLASFPAGLVLYWTSSNIITIIQQLANMHREGVEIHLLRNIAKKLKLRR